MAKETTEKTARKLAEFISNLEYDSIPNEVLEKAKELVLDVFRLSVAGSQVPWGQLTYEVFRKIEGKEESTALGFGDRLPAIHAAYVNGVTSHGFENDDTHAGAILHPGVVVIPAVLALTEREGLGGKELLKSMIAGYEVMIRVGMAMQPSLLNDRGFHATSVVGHFGAAAGSANLLGLSSDQTVHALAFAAAYASGLVNWLSGGMVKAIHAGKAAKAGIESSLLAAVGITGPRKIFEGNYGFCHAYADRFDLDLIIKGLGNEWKTMEVHLKPHATTRNIQSAIEAAAIIASDHEIQPQNVDSVEIRTAPGLLTDSEVSVSPVDVIEAQSSFPYAIATTLFKGGKRILKEFLLFEDLKNAIGNPEIQSLAQRILVKPDIAFDLQKFCAEVTIRLKNGNVYKQQVDIMRGCPENPLTKEEVQGRFLAQAGSAIPRERLLKTIDAVDRLEKVMKIEEVTGLLS